MQWTISSLYALIVIGSATEVDPLLLKECLKLLGSNEEKQGSNDLVQYPPDCFAASLRNTLRFRIGKRILRIQTHAD